jgi:predicted TPR repeat methyltransferase
VYVYVGDLTKVFSGVRQGLRPDGLFCFSVEEDDTGDYVLRSSNRYAHSLGFVRRLADQHGFLIGENAARSARQENGEAMAIEVVVMRRK